MNDERVAKILDWLAERITKAENFVLEQAPDVVQQIITMDVVVAFIGVIFFATLLVAAVIIGLICWRTAIRWGAGSEASIPLWVFGVGGMSAAVIGLSLGILANGTLIAKATYAPKAYLLQRVGVLK